MSLPAVEAWFFLIFVLVTVTVADVDVEAAAVAVAVAAAGTGLAAEGAVLRHAAIRESRGAAAEDDHAAALAVASARAPAAGAADGLIVVEPASIDRERGGIRNAEEDRGADRAASAHAVATNSPGPTGPADRLILREHGAGDAHGRVRVGVEGPTGGRPAGSAAPPAPPTTVLPESKQLTIVAVVLGSQILDAAARGDPLRPGRSCPRTRRPDCPRSRCRGRTESQGRLVRAPPSLTVEELSGGAPAGIGPPWTRLPMNVEPRMVVFAEVSDGAALCGRHHRIAITASCTDGLVAR